MATTTDAATDESTTKVTIYHTRFVDTDDRAFEMTRDIRMGFEWAVEHDVDPQEFGVVDTAYELAGTFEVEVDPSQSAESVAYMAWEEGDGHDPTSTRSMSTGDVIVVNRAGDDVAYFVDSVGFEEINAVAFDRVFGGHLSGD